MRKTLDFPENIKIRILSDLHLGHPKSTVKNVFQLKQLIENQEIVVFAGDTYEGRASNEFCEAGLNLYEELIEFCAACGVEAIFLAGNHDPNEEIRLLEIYNESVAVMHGDAVFLTSAPWSREYLGNKDRVDSLVKATPEAMIDLAARFELARKISEAVPLTRMQDFRNKYMDFFRSACWPPSRPIRILGTWALMTRKTNQFAEKFFPKARVVIYGHFHRVGVWKNSKRTIINLGAFFKLSRSFCVSISAGKLIVNEIAEKNGGFCLGKKRSCLAISAKK